MSFDYSTIINEDNYLEVLNYISQNRNKYEAIRRKRRTEAAKSHVAKYDIKVGTRFTYTYTDVYGKQAVYYLEVKGIRQTRASCKGIQTLPKQSVCSHIEVDITDIIPDSEKV
jgi:hypothetical protein